METRRAYAPTSNNASHDNHEKITMRKSNNGFPFLSHMSMGLHLEPPRAAKSMIIDDKME